MASPDHPVGGPAEPRLAELSRYLEAHPKIRKVWYPGLESHPAHVRARELFDQIVQQAHHNGEPGVLFLDELTEFRLPVDATGWWTPGRGWNRYEYHTRNLPVVDITLAGYPGITYDLVDNTGSPPLPSTYTASPSATTQRTSVRPHRCGMRSVAMAPRAAATWPWSAPTSMTRRPRGTRSRMARRRARPRRFTALNQDAENAVGIAGLDFVGVHILRQ